MQKIVCVLLLAITLAVAYEHIEHHHHHAHIPYKYEYGVKDPHTKDHKKAWEHGDGHGGVKGGYAFDEADGTHRVVEYHDDGKSGLQATVKRVGHAHHPEKYGHDDHHGYHGHGHASSYANQNQKYEHHHHGHF